jgi:hypothetical protein
MKGLIPLIGLLVLATILASPSASAVYDASASLTHMVTFMITRPLPT